MTQNPATIPANQANGASGASEDESVKYGLLLGCVLFGLFLWFLPTPQGLSTTGWHLLTLFITTIVTVVVKPMPVGTIALVALTLTIVTKTLTPAAALKGFSDDVIWLVVLALFIAKGFSVTGLGNRLAYYFTKLLGKKTLGLSYGLVATDLIMAPAIVSVTGRIGGIIYPIIRGIADSYESMPFDKSARKIGAFLTVTSFQCSVVTCAMFMTAMAANPLIAGFVADRTDAYPILKEFTWTMWALAAIVPGLISLIVIPWVIYKIYPPEIKETPMASQIASDKLKAMGRVSLNEWIMIGTIASLLVMWIFGKDLGIKPVTAALVGIGALLVSKVLDWKSLVKMDSVWDTFFWFAILLMMAANLGELGVSTWISQSIEHSVGGMDWRLAFPGILLFYFYSHYLFASSTAHVTSMYIPFLLVSITLGTPPLLAVLCLTFVSNLYGGLTHYSLTPAPLLFGAGYVNIKDWWKIGFIVSVINIIIWSTAGLFWWKFLGYW